MMNISSTMLNQFLQNFWQPQLMSPQPAPIPIQQFQQAQSSWQPSQQFFPQSQAIQTIQQSQPIREMLPPPPYNSANQESSSLSRNPKALPSFGTVMSITGGSAMEFEIKRQRKTTSDM
jgi:hypothetical protein